jgi:hypothetical protein
MPRKRTTVTQYKKLMFRLPKELLEFIHETAEVEQRSMNSQILYVLLAWKKTQAQRTAGTPAQVA